MDATPSFGQLTLATVILFFKITKFYLLNYTPLEMYHLNKWGDIDGGKEKLASVTFFSFENWMTNMTWSNPTILLPYYASFWRESRIQLDGAHWGGDPKNLKFVCYIKWWNWHANFFLVFQCLSCYVNFRSILDA